MFRLSSLKTPAAIWVMAIFCYSLILQLCRHYGFMTNAFDMIFFDHVSWNISRGMGQFVGPTNINHLAVHSYLVFFLIAPLYKIVATPIWLFIIQSLAIAGTAYPIYKIAEKELGPKGGHLALAALVLYYPFRRTPVFELHGDILMMTAVAWALYGIVFNRASIFLLSCIAIPMFKENGGLLSFSLGLWALSKRQYVGIAGGGIGLAISAFLMGWFIPQFRSDDYKFIASHYGYLNTGLLKGIFYQPADILSRLFSPDRLGFLLLLVAPLGFTAFGSSAIFASFGLLLPYMVADFPSYPNFFDLSHYYVFPFIPIIFVSSILGWKKWRTAIQNRQLYRRIFKGWIGLFVGVNILAFIAMDARGFWLDSQRIQSLKQVLQSIPPSASVSASNHLVPHLYYRDNIWIFPTINSSDYIVVEGEDPLWPWSRDAATNIDYLWRNQQKWNAIKALIKGERSFSPAIKSDYQAALTRLHHNPEYQLISQEGSSPFIFKRQLHH